ncbi:MAG: hypothetical protein AB7V62_12930 [Thermoleophilia bacterium]
MAPAAPDLDEYRAAVERLLTGGGADPALFTPDAVTGLAAAGPALRPLARFAAEGLLRAASAADVAEAEEMARLPLVAGPDGPVAAADVDLLLAAEPDAARRRELGAARLRVLESHVAGSLADAAARRDEAARGAGAASALALVAGAAGVDGDTARDGAARLLDSTDDAHARALDALARDALGISAAALDAADLPRLTSAPDLEEALPGGGATAAAARTREGMELAGVVVPAPAAERLGAYAEALRGTGATLARAGAAPRLPVEARLLPDPALAGAAARLFEGLLGEPAWAARVLGATDPDALARTAQAAGLLGLRATAARVAALGSADPEGMGRALGVRWPEVLTAADPLTGLGPLDDLRARALAAALAAHLRETHGPRWFGDPRAGAFLREIWLEGGRIDPEELARELGAPGLDPAPLAG